jgi:hypothetical protein
VHVLGQLLKERLRVVSGEARLMSGQNPVLRRAETEMVDTQVG